jgi:long-chain acyl-CoA synthetase
LGWVDLTLALERDLDIVLKESAIARIVTLRDFLREAATAPKVEKGAAAVSAEAPWLAPLGLGATLFRATGELLLGVVMRWVFHLRVEGCEFLPAQDPIFFCPNHVSYLDPFALGMALPKERLHHTSWGGWTGVAFTTRFRRFFSRVARVIPIDPDRAAASGLAMGGETLARGWNLVWFPEGARSADGTLQRFLPGIGAILRQHPVPVIPVSIEGTFAAWPVARKFPRPGRLIVRFGKPIDPASLPVGAVERLRDQEIATAIQAQVAALARSDTIRA